MNIFSKNFLAFSLLLAFSVPAQANWLSNFKDSIVKKKKTLATGFGAGILLTGIAIKFANKWCDKLSWEGCSPEDRAELLRMQAIPAENKPFWMNHIALPPKRNSIEFKQLKKGVQMITVALTSALITGLTYKAHKMDLFGEREHLVNRN